MSIEEPFLRWRGRGDKLHFHLVHFELERRSKAAFSGSSLAAEPTF